MNNELLINALSFLSSDLLWGYFALVVLAFYLVTALFTWSFRRPLKFLGIPSIIVGVLFIISYIIVNNIPLSDTLIKIIVSSAKPLLTIGIIFIVMGIAMLVLSRVLKIAFKKSKRKREPEVVTEELKEEKTEIEEQNEEENIIESDEEKRP